MFNNGENGDIFPRFFRYAGMFQEILPTVFSGEKKTNQTKTNLLYASAKNRRITTKTTNKSYMKIIEYTRRCLSFLAVEV